MNDVAVPQSADGQRALVAEAAPHGAPRLHGLLAEFLGLSDPEHGARQAAVDEEPQDRLGGHPRLACPGRQLDHRLERSTVLLTGGQHRAQLSLMGRWKGCSSVSCTLPGTTNSALLVFGPAAGVFGSEAHLP